MVGLMRGLIMKNIMLFIIMMAALMGGCLPCAFADYYAAQNGQVPSNPYNSWATAASNIQDAVNAAANHATVWVGAGRYTVPPNATNYVGGSNVVFVNRPLTLRSSNGAPETVIIDGEDANALHALAVQHGMLSLYEDGLRKVAAGATSLDELARVTQDQSDA